MGRQWWENRAKRAYWATHLEAWLRSGLARTTYCREHRLNRRTFDRWRDALNVTESLRHKAARRRRRQSPPANGAVTDKAVQAFWAMHVEALQWSGLTAQAYAQAHRLGPENLRQWRRRLEADPDPIDWRALVHPSARPPVEGTISTRTKDRSSLTAPQRERRRFSEAEKRAMLAEIDELGVTVTAVARRHGIIPGMLFRWRVQLGLAPRERATFAQVRLPAGASAAPVLQVQLPVPDGAVAVDLPGGRRVFAAPGSDPEAVRRFVAEREGRS